MYISRLLLLPLLILLLTFCSEVEENTYNLTLTATPEEGGDVSDLSGDYEEGTIVEITASPGDNWLFENWEGDYTGTEFTAQILMDSDKDIAAIFAKKNYPLTIEIEGEGNVNEVVVHQKSTDYPHGTVVELTAEPADGWRFSSWEEAVTGTTNPVQITIEKETFVKAVFEPVTFNLTVETDGEGNVFQELEQAKTTGYNEGDRVTLTAEAASGWIFSEWDGDLAGSENPATIIMDSNKSVTAVFNRVFTLSTSVEPLEGGQIKPDGGEFVRDSEIEVEAVPAGPGWEFERGEGDFSGSLNPFSLTMNGNKTLIAFFNRKEFMVELGIEGEGEIETTLLSGAETENGFYYESELELTATPEEGWNFIGWQGDLSSDENPLIVFIDSSYSVTAVFQEDNNGKENNDEEESDDS